jgi:hypothetical protein
MVISLRIKLLLSPEHLRKWSLGSIPPPHPPDKQLSTQGIAVSREPLSEITKNDHRQTQAPSTIAEFDTSHSNFVYLPASIRSHNTCQTLEAVSPLRAELKSGWNEGAGHGLNEELMARTNGNGSSTKSKSPSAKKLSPQQKIAQRAYEIYLERNGAPGNPLDDWVRAERELLQKSRKSIKKTAAAAA